MTQPAAPAPQAGPQGTPNQPPAQPSPQPAPPSGQPAQPQPTAPPWGTADQFDPEKAWSLIQNLRGDVAQQKARVAELTPYEQKAKELEEAQKTELQRAQEAAAAAQAEAEKSRLELLRHTVATTKGVPAALIPRLQGGTKEELEADADALLAAFPQPAASAGNPRTPVEALRPGAMPNPADPSLDDQIAAANKAGNWREVLRLQNTKLANASTQ